MLATKYNVKTAHVYFPEYHCEMNATEGLWRSQKALVCSRTDQKFETTIKSISDPWTHFGEQQITLKLF